MQSALFTGVSSGLSESGICTNTLFASCAFAERDKPKAKRTEIIFFMVNNHIDDTNISERWFLYVGSILFCSQI